MILHIFNYMQFVGRILYIKGYATVPECRGGLAEFFERYNYRREHTSLEGYYPADVYFGKVAITKAA